MSFVVAAFTLAEVTVMWLRTCGHNVPSLLAVAWIVVGCTQRSDAHAPKATAAAALHATSATCPRPVRPDDPDALECSGGAALRAGDTLRLRLAQHETTLVNTHGEVDFVYRYLGRVGRRAVHLVEQYGGEQPPQFLLIDPQPGHLIRVPGMPVLSPDSLRFAAANATWDCAEFPDQRLEVWRFMDSVPVREWQLEKLRCPAHGEPNGWAATGPVWQGNDTLGFTRRGSLGDRGESGLATHDARGWRLLVPSG